jgi:MFS transporter, DHA2 family, multidrug resistance protein
LKGDEWAYAAGIIAVLLGAVLVFFKFPKGQDEKLLLAQYQTEDSQGTPGGAERAPELSGVPKAQPAGP